MLTNPLAVVIPRARVQNPGIVAFTVLALLTCAWALLDAPAEAYYAASTLIRENSAPATPARAVAAPSVVALVSAPALARAAPSDWIAGVEKLAIAHEYSPGIIRAQSAPAVTPGAQGIVVAAGNARPATMAAPAAAVGASASNSSVPPVTSPAIEAEIKRALAVPPPAPLVASPFPLAR